MATSHQVSVKETGVSADVSQDPNRYETAFARNKAPMKPQGGRYCYTRTQCPAFDDLQKEVLTWYGRDPKNFSTILHPSGLCAISTVFCTLFRDWVDPVIIYGSQLYCDTPTIIQYWPRSQASSKPTLIPVHMGDPSGKTILELCRTHKLQVAAVYIESCANPSGEILDPKLYQKIKEVVPYSWLIVDNTWLSPAGFNPFDWGGRCSCGVGK